MPNDYLDIKFASQIAQGSVTLEQLAEFKAQYGIGDNSFKGIISGSSTPCRVSRKECRKTIFMFVPTGILSASSVIVLYIDLITIISLLVFPVQ